MKAISQGQTMKVCLRLRVERNINSFLDVRLPRRHGTSLNLDTGSLEQYLRRVKIQAGILDYYDETIDVL